MNLPTVQTPEQIFAIVALDEAMHLADKLGFDLSTDNGKILIKKLLATLIQIYSPVSSGLILDPVYSWEALKNKSHQSGLFLRLGQISEGVDPLTTPKLINNWGVEDIKNNYGIAKLELFYHPAEEKALEKKQLVSEIFDYCNYEKIDFLLKLVIYTPADQELDQVKFQESQLEAIAEFRSLANIIALQYPFDALSCATMTAELDIPWIVLLDGQNSYESIKEMLRASVENGAQGFLVDEALYKEIYQMRLEDESPDFVKIEKFLKTVSRDRLIELVRISNEIVQEFA